MGRLVGPFEIDVDEHGVAVVTFDRPPVNAVSIQAYEAIGQVVELIESSDDVRVAVLTAPAGARAWCGGADLNDFVGMDSAGRKERYARINELLPRLYDLDRPVIAAVNSHAVGIGVIIAAMCDIRVAADTATFSCPEIDYGLVAGGAGLLARLGFPEGIMREMLYTGRRYAPEELRLTGFLNHVVPQADVLAKGCEIAWQIATKSLPAVKARKRVSNAIEGLGWLDAYLLSQRASADLTGGDDAEEGVRAFLEHRQARLVDR